MDGVGHHKIKVNIIKQILFIVVWNKEIENIDQMHYNWAAE